MAGGDIVTQQADGVEEERGQNQDRATSGVDLGWLRDNSETLGFLPGVELQIAAGVILVEGEHDRLVLEKFFGSAISAARLLIQPIRGTKNSRSFGENELLAKAGLRFAVLFDSVRAAYVNAYELPDGSSAEEKELFQLLMMKRNFGTDIFAVEFDLPDITAALPMDAILRAYPNATAIDMNAFCGEFASEMAGKRGFKKVLLDRLNLSNNLGPDEFVRAVLDHASDADGLAAPHPALTGASDLGGGDGGRETGALRA